MSLLNRIITYMKFARPDDEVQLSELYEQFKDEKKTTIRGRINEAVGTKLVRVGVGRYLLTGDEIVAIVEQIDSRFAIPQIIKAMIYYDCIMLDIPYRLAGQKAGNRDLSAYNLIEVAEFEKIILQLEKILANENSQVIFMIAGGKSSAAGAMKYKMAFGPTNLKVAAQGYYQKLKKDGITPCNMGAHIMPKEEIFIYSHSGKLLKPDETKLDFDVIRPKLPRQGGYPTQKPLSMIKQLIKAASHKGEIVADFFGGSGSTLEACLELGRKCHIMDIADDSIKRMKSILQRHESKIMPSLVSNSVNNQSYSNEQMAAFNSGSLF